MCVPTRLLNGKQSCRPIDPQRLQSSCDLPFGLTRALRWFAGDYHEVAPFSQLRADRTRLVLHLGGRGFPDLSPKRVEVCEPQFVHAPQLLRELGHQLLGLCA